MQSGSAREERRDWEDCADALSLLLLLLSSSSPRSQTHTHTHLQARSPKVHSHFAVRNWRLSPGALRGRVWRQEESREIEAEEGDEEVEEEDVYDEGREKKQREVDWRRVFLAGCGAAYLRLETRDTLPKEKETKTHRKWHIGRETQTKRDRVRKDRKKEKERMREKSVKWCYWC